MPENQQIEVKMADFAETPTLDKSKPIGIYGTKVFGGFLSEEYNLRLQGTRKWSEWEKMANDATINQNKSAVTLPIRNAKWDVERPNDSKVAQDMQTFSRQQLFKRPEQRWEGLLEQILDFTFDGISWFEKIFTTDDFDGKQVVVWKEIAYRYPRTIFRYNNDEETEKLKSIEQMAENAGTGLLETNTIPVERLIIFTKSKYGADYEGKGYNRILYRQYKQKDLYEKALAIYIDRFAAGILNINTPSGTLSNDDVRDKIEEMAKDIRSGEKAYIITEEGMTIEVLQGGTKGGSTGTSPIIAAIRLQEDNMAKTVLAQFLNLGTTQSGSRALGDVGVNFFLLTVQAVADQVADELTLHLHELLAMNWDKATHGDSYPIVTVKGIQHKDIKIISDAFANFKNGGAIETGDKETEQHIRNALEFPPLSDDAVELDNKVQQEKLKQKKQALKDMKAGIIPIEPNQPPDTGTGQRQNPPQIENDSEAVPDEQNQPKQVVAIENDDDVRKFIHETLAPLSRNTARQVAREAKSETLRRHEEIVLNFREIEQRIVDMQNRVGTKATNFFTTYEEKVVKGTSAGVDPRIIRPAGLNKFLNSIKLELRETHKQGRTDYQREFDIVTGKQESVEFIETIDEKFIDDTLKHNDYYKDEILKFVLPRNAVIPNPKWLQDLIDEAEAIMLAEVRRIQDNALAAQFRVNREGATGAQRLSIITESVGTLSIDGLTKAVKQTVNVAYGEGRKAQSAKKTSEGAVQQEIYSAVFDNMICSLCAPKDGLVHVPGDPLFTAPNPECLGNRGRSNGCRCINIPFRGLA